jgi:Tol biopolymer transport system component
MIGAVNGTENSNIRQPDDFNLSPDGHTAAIGKTISGNKDIWLIDIDRGVPRRFTFQSGWDGHAIWSPDGKQIVFSALRKGVLDLYVRATSEKDPETPLIESPQGKVAQDWSPDGRFLLYQQSSAQTSDDLFILPLGGDVRKPAPIPVVQTAALECCGRFSPDGRTIAYQSWETGRSEIYIQPFMGGSGKQRISTDGGVAARWRRDGKELYYRTTDGRLMAVPIESVGGTIKAGTAVSLFRISTPVYAPSIDGQKFLVNVVTEPASPITILLNWKP